MGFPGSSVVKNPPTIAGDMGSILGQEDRLNTKWQPSSVFLPGKFHRWWSLVGYSPWGSEDSDMTKWLSIVYNLYIYIYIYIYTHTHSYIQLLVHPFIHHGHLGCSHVLPVNNTPVTMGVQISFWVSVFIAFGYIPRNQIAGSYGSSNFNVFEDPPYCSPQWPYRFIFPSTVPEGPCSPHPCQRLFSITFLGRAILIGVR